MPSFTFKSSIPNYFTNEIILISLNINTEVKIRSDPISRAQIK